MKSKWIKIWLIAAALLLSAIAVSAESEIIESVVVDADSETLTVSGFLPTESAEWVSVEILKENVCWTTEEAMRVKDTEGLSVRPDSLEDFDPKNTSDSIMNYLLWFGQVDNKGGQSYSFTVKGYPYTQEPEMRLRIGKDNYFYYSPKILELLNAAQSADDIKEAFMGSDYLRSASADEYALLKSEAEKTSFWTNYYAYRNSCPGGEFTSLQQALSGIGNTVRITKLQAVSDETGLTALLELCGGYGLSDENSCELFLGIDEFYPTEASFLNASQKAALVSSVIAKKNTYTSTDDFVDDFNEAVVLYAVSGSDSKYLVQGVLTTSTLTKDRIDSLTALSQTEQLAICDTVNKSAVYDSIDALLSAISPLIPPQGEGGQTETDTNTGNNDHYSGESAGSVSSGGGGGGGGGGSRNEEPEEPAIEPEEKDVFSDLGDVEWAQEAIYALREKGIVSGRSDKIFDPTSTVTREEFAKMLVLAVGCYDEGAAAEFTDVSASEWSYSYIASAAKNGLINGIGDGKFGKGSAISRQDMAVMLARACGFNGGNSASGFADDASISDYARASVGYVREKGLMNGVGDNNFAPQMQVSRAQAAKAIYEFIIRG